MANRDNCMKKDIPEAKSLRWLANSFPFTELPLDETDKMSNAIHVYCKAGAEKIEKLQEENEMLLELCRNKGFIN